MGAPKQKWLHKEEVALKAGVAKHGVGRWCTILKDPEFSSELYLRSNVDLKDKWRNMTAMLNGLGSRAKARSALTRVQQAPMVKDGNPLTDTIIDHNDEGSGDVRPLSSSSGSPHIGSSKRSMIRLDDLIMEAINNLKEPDGSKKTTICAYIEEQYWAPPNFKRHLSKKLKFLTETGILDKKERQYRILSSDENKILTMVEGMQNGTVDKNEISVLSKSEHDLRSMTPETVAAAVAQAVAEAEAAIAAAEEAVRVAEAAEADAETIKAFADATMKTLKGEPLKGWPFNGVTIQPVADDSSLAETGFMGTLNWRVAVVNNVGGSGFADDFSV